MTDLYDACWAWANKRVGSFPKWGKKELQHEAYIAAMDMIHKWDPDRRPIQVFLKNFLFDPVHRKYCKLHDIMIIREKNPDGSYKPREYVHLSLEYSEYFEDNMAYEPTPWPCGDISEYEDEELGARTLETMHLIARGLSKTETARAAGISQGRISQIIRRLRDAL